MRHAPHRFLNQLVSFFREARSNVASVDVTTGLVTLWNPGTVYCEATYLPSYTCSPVVSSFGFSGNTVYIGGQFETVGGEAHGSIAGVTAPDEIFHNGFE